MILKAWALAMLVTFSAGFGVVFAKLHDHTEVMNVTNASTLAILAIGIVALFIISLKIEVE